MPRDQYSENRIADFIGSNTEPPTEQESAIAQEARQRVSESANATEKFRRQRLADRAFIERHFTDDEVKTRQGTNRPALELHATEYFVSRVMDDFRNAGINFRIGSATSETGDPAAKAYDGLAKRDQRDNLSSSQMEQIAREAIMYGEAWGKWTLVDEGGRNVDSAPGLFTDESTVISAATLAGLQDKRLRLVSCLNDNIYPDESDTTPDRSDMNFLIEVEELSVEERNRRYPDRPRLPANLFNTQGFPHEFLVLEPRDLHGRAA